MIAPHELVITTAYLLLGLGQAYLFVRWLYRKWRDAEVNSRFIKDMATNHLPHIHYALSRLAEHLHLDIGDPPPIQFMRFNGKDK